MEQTDILRYAVRTLEHLQIPYLIVGSFASSIWGEPRFTMDIDMVLDLHPEKIKTLCEAFAAPEFYVSESAVREAVASHRQFNVIHPASANKIDFVVAQRTGWSQLQLSRGQLRQFDPDLTLCVQSRRRHHLQNAILPRGTIPQAPPGYRWDS